MNPRNSIFTFTSVVVIFVTLFMHETNTSEDSPRGFQPESVTVAHGENNGSDSGSKVMKIVPQNETNPDTPSSLVDDTPLNAECSKHSDCPYNHCCTVGMMRFTFPSCSPLGQLDEACRPNAVSRNFTLAYPNLKSIKVKEAYLMFCPCGANLVCDRNSATCQLPSGETHGDYGNTIEIAEQ